MLGDFVVVGGLVVSLALLMIAAVLGWGSVQGFWKRWHEWRRDQWLEQRRQERHARDFRGGEL